MHPRSFFVFALPLLVVAACGGSASSEPPTPAPGPKDGPPLFTDGPTPGATDAVATKDLYPSMSVRSDENGIHVTAALIYPANHFLVLGPGDSLTATIGATTQTLTREAEDDGHVHYVATFARDDSASKATIAFLRTGGQPSAPNNVVPIAPAFDVSGPKSARSVADAPLFSAIEANVTPAIGRETPVTFRVQGACVPPQVAGKDQSTFTDGEGHVVVALNDLLDPVARDCALSIEVREPTQGSWDPAFDTDASKDVFEGAQARSFAITWNPSDGS